MKLLMINKYLYPKGGAETYVLRLGRYLETQGHQVQYFGMEHPGNVVGNRAAAYTKNVNFHKLTRFEQLRWAARVIYSAEARKKLRLALEDFQPEVCHLNNFNYQLTPSILLEIRKWSRETGNPCRIVYTAHDYQLICPNHMCYDGKAVCKDCLGSHYGNCIGKRCIHGSFLRSCLGALESLLWHKLGVYRELDAVLCCSNFMKKMLDTDPVLRKKTVVIHNFIETAERRQREKGGYILYFGRFSEEKGIRLLVQAAKELPHIPFVFAGEGDLAKELEGIENVSNVGFQSGDALRTWIRGARFTVVPSVWYENCPFAVLESLNLGVPVLGADIGGIPELIEPGTTGNLFLPGSLESLKNAMLQMWENTDGDVIYKGVTLPEYVQCLQSHYLPGGMVTVVVPVYNTASYLERCIKSILNQTYRNLEILLIDDGSLDCSGKLCDAWAEKDRRIRVIHKENAGLGMARNTGILEAAGDVICFVDSDDYLLPQTLEKAYGKLRQEQAEVVLFGMIWEQGGKRPIRHAKETYRGSEVQRVFLPALLRQEGAIPISSCTALYSMELVRRAVWRFPSERKVIAEDVYALLQLYGYAASVTMVEDALYVYCQNNASLTRSYREDRFARIKDFYHDCLNVCDKQLYAEEVGHSCAAPFLGILIGCMKQEAAHRNWDAIRKIVEDPVVRKALSVNTEKPGWKKQLLFYAMHHSWVLVCGLLLAQNLLQEEGFYANRD